MHGLQVFHYAKKQMHSTETTVIAIDFKIGYYEVLLNPDTCKIHIMILAWAKY